ncbi:MAG: NAD-dependent epimerase/dehydratase family protein, partial [Caldilineae bacterium]
MVSCTSMQTPSTAPQFPKETTSLVTGATGFIGRHLLKRLLQTGGHVKALTRRAGRPLMHHARLQWVYGDITDPSSLNDVLKGVDVVYHLAAEMQNPR